MTITVEIKNVYGNEKIYPVCEKAKHFADMLDQKCLTRENISYIKRLGFSVEVSQPKVEL